MLYDFGTMLIGIWMWTKTYCYWKWGLLMLKLFENDTTDKMHEYWSVNPLPIIQNHLASLIESISS